MSMLSIDPASRAAAAAVSPEALRRRSKMRGGDDGRARILTTHTGPLPRRALLVDRIAARAEADFSQHRYAGVLAAAVSDCVSTQCASGVSIVGDGEERSAFTLYMQDRLSGLEPRPGRSLPGFRKKLGLFLEDFERWLLDALRGGAAVSRVPMICTGPVEYTGHDELRQDLANLATATTGCDCDAAFMPSIAPGAIEANAYYSNEAKFHEAIADAMRAEYLAIVDSGFMLQIDDPHLPALHAGGSSDGRETDRRAHAYIDLLNHALRGIPAERIRYRMISAVPASARALKANFAAIAGQMLGVAAGTYLFDASLARYEEDAELWQHLRFPDGKILSPGLVGCAGQETRPDALAARIVRFAGRVGRSGIVPSAENRGLALTQLQLGASATVWNNVAALNDGARRASRHLWNRPASSLDPVFAAA